MSYFIFLVLGTLYGFLFGLIPVAGATTALITVYSFIGIFYADPYTLVIFTTAVVVSSSIGDSFASIVMNIPGAGGSAATMVDGFPMSQQGESARALSAAMVTSTVNAIIWGCLVFAFLPLYATSILKFGIPEMLSFLILAFGSICFVSNKYWARGLLALALGIFLGLVGQNPITGAERWTLDWQYLGDGIQLVPMLAGIFAFPELIEAYKNKSRIVKTKIASSNRLQIWQGVKDSWKYKWDGLRGGFIGAVIGIIPGIGGNIADWLAYGQTIALNQKDKIPFGKGNVRGVIGCEGANNAQKATSYVPTILFGIPGAPFEVIILSLYMLVGFELGSPEMLTDLTFFNNVFSSYFWSLLISVGVGLVFIKYAVMITTIPFAYYFYSIMTLLLWSSVQYTGYWEDYAIFAMCCVFGIILKKLKLNRAALIIGFVLADRLESSWLQYDALYNITDIFYRPISGTLLSITALIIIYGLFFNKQRIDYV